MSELTFVFSQLYEYSTHLKNFNT